MVPAEKETNPPWKKFTNCSPHGGTRKDGVIPSRRTFIWDPQGPSGEAVFYQHHSQTYQAEL